MKKELLKYLRCPQCNGEFNLDALTIKGSEVLEGGLSCRCSNYKIINGVPRLIYGKLNPPQKRSKESFSREWLEYYQRLGFNNIEEEKEKFLNYTRTVPSYFKNKLVLDAGCGNGRYSNIASKLGAKVIAVDISESVEVAYQNLISNKNTSILQANIFNLPFQKEIFDFIFSIGVLHHTPDAKLAFKNLLNYLKPGGEIAIFVYAKGNPILYFMNKTLRNNISKLPTKLIWYLTNIPTIFGKALHLFPYFGSFVHNILLQFVFFSQDHHNNFDAYSAGYTSFHTKEELKEWFQDLDDVIIIQTGAAKESLFARGTKKQIK